MKSDLKYDSKNMKSLRIYPKNQRPKMDDVTSVREGLSLVALRAAEKEVKHLMEVANRRLEKVDSIIREHTQSGQHLLEDVFIPEYLGFIEVVPEKVGDIRIYGKDGYNVTRLEDYNWLMYTSDGVKIVITLPNMFVAITVLESLGLDVNIKDYMAGAYTDQKGLYETIEGAMEEALERREE